jgi:hypothetical protein
VQEPSNTKEFLDSIAGFPQTPAELAHLLSLGVAVEYTDDEWTATTAGSAATGPVNLVGYFLHGGRSYETGPVSASDVFITLEDAVTEWILRRSDIRGRFPNWGPESATDTAIVYSSESDVYEAWSVIEAFKAVGIEIDSLAHYYDPAYIAAIPLASSGTSHDRQVEAALDALNEPDLWSVRRQYPEALIWAEGPSGAWLDTEAMKVDPEWSSWVCDAIENTGAVQWVDGEPYLVGLDALELLADQS